MLAGDEIICSGQRCQAHPVDLAIHRAHDGYTESIENVKHVVDLLESAR